MFPLRSVSASIASFVKLLVVQVPHDCDKDEREKNNVKAANCKLYKPNCSGNINSAINFPEIRPTPAFTICVKIK